jgi:hypothetical protein
MNQALLSNTYATAELGGGMEWNEQIQDQIRQKQLTKFAPGIQDQIRQKQPTKFAPGIHVQIQTVFKQHQHIWQQRRKSKYKEYLSSTYGNKGERRTSN